MHSCGSEQCFKCGTLGKAMVQVEAVVTCPRQHRLAPNHSIERPGQRLLRALWPAAHVERYADMVEA
jgi:hypothetical protein